jgi:hypothetical protein
LLRDSVPLVRFFADEMSDSLTRCFSRVIPVQDMDMMQYSMNPMAMHSPSDQNSGFMGPYHGDMQGFGMDPMAFDNGNDPGGKNRNRGNYRCSKVHSDVRPVRGVLTKSNRL